MVLSQEFSLTSKFFQNHIEFSFQIQTFLRLLSLHHVIIEHVTHSLEL
jgi:hypothetical protein